MQSGDHRRMQLTSAVSYETSCERHTVAVYLLLLNVSTRLRLNSARGFACWLLASRSTSERVKAHLNNIACSRCAPSRSGPCASESHCCSAATSGFDRACIRPRPSWTFGRNLSTFSLCGTSSGTSAFVTLGCSGILSNTSSACCWPCPFSRVPGSRSLAGCLWVLGSQPLAVLRSSRPCGTCFVQHSAHPWMWWTTSMPTFPSESPLLFNPWTLLSSDVTGFRNTQASQENANHHLPRILGCSLLCRRTKSAAPPVLMTSDADSTVCLASFTTAHVDTRIVSVIRSTSCPSSTEVTPLKTHAAKHRVQPPTLAHQCLQLHCDQPSSEGHAINSSVHLSDIKSTFGHHSAGLNGHGSCPTLENSLRPYQQEMSRSVASRWTRIVGSTSPLSDRNSITRNRLRHASFV